MSACWPTICTQSSRECIYAIARLGINVSSRLYETKPRDTMKTSNWFIFNKDSSLWILLPKQKGIVAMTLQIDQTGTIRLSRASRARNDQAALFTSTLTDLRMIKPSKLLEISWRRALARSAHTTPHHTTLGTGICKAPQRVRVFLVIRGNSCALPEQFFRSYPVLGRAATSCLFFRSALRNYLGGLRWFLRA